MKLYPIAVDEPKKVIALRGTVQRRQKVYYCISSECREQVVQIAKKNNRKTSIPAVGNATEVNNRFYIPTSYRALLLLHTPGAQQIWAESGIYDLVDREGSVYGQIEVKGYLDIP